jgi:hypothetical protein
VQREIWKPHDRNALCCFLYVVNENNIVDGKKPQIMHYMFCHINPINFNPRIEQKRDYMGVIIIK